jgi:hypothetical protein
LKTLKHAKVTDDPVGNQRTLLWQEVDQSHECARPSAPKEMLEKDFFSPLESGDSQRATRPD